MNTGRQRDTESGLDWLEARSYDARIGRFFQVDPLADVGVLRSWSPYHYSFGNPVRYKDPTGASPSDFYDENQTLMNHVEDGSNAVYHVAGSGTGKHFEFVGFDESQGGSNEINLESAIQEAQNLNAVNPSLKPDGQSYCNFATQNVLTSVASALGNDQVLVTGRANDMVRALDGSTEYQRVSREAAFVNAHGGGLSIIGEAKKDGSGHVATLSVGTNRSAGEVANIGRTNGFMPIHGAGGVFRQSANLQYFILKNKK